LGFKLQFFHFVRVNFHIIYLSKKSQPQSADSKATANKRQIKYKQKFCDKNSSQIFVKIYNAHFDVPQISLKEINMNIFINIGFRKFFLFVPYYIITQLVEIWSESINPLFYLKK
jgi:glutaredoxin